MATYVHNKSRAFQKLEDISPSKQRSEARLKTYSSATDTRAWAQSALDSRQYFFEFMSNENTSVRKKSSQIIPVNVVWNILLANKNTYIVDLESRIQSFVHLLQQINLSQSQIARVRYMCTTTFCSINDYLQNYKPTEQTDRQVQSTGNIHPTWAKGIQVIPSTQETKTEASIAMCHSASATLGELMKHECNSTQEKVFVAAASATEPCLVGHVAMQVVLAPKLTADKGVWVRVRSSTEGVKKPSAQPSTQLSTHPIDLPTKHPDAEKADKPIVAKTQSVMIKAKSDSSNASKKPRKSCVTFNVKEKDAASRAPIDPKEVIRNAASSQMSSEVIEVISEAAQTITAKCGDLPLVQIYRSTKKASSIESTFIPTSAHAFQALTLGPLLRKHSTSVVAGVAGDVKKLVSKNFIESPAHPFYDETDEDDQFEDCLPTAREQREQESQVISCKRKKKKKGPEFMSCLNQAVRDVRKTFSKATQIASYLKTQAVGVSTDKLMPIDTNVDAELARQKTLAENALDYLEVVRQTLQTNEVIIARIDVGRIRELLYSEKSAKDVENFPCCLIGCGIDNIEPSVLLQELLLAVQAYCSAILTPNASCIPPFSAPSCGVDTDDLEPEETHITCEKMQVQVDYYKKKLNRFEQITLEHMKLQGNVIALKKELKLYDKIKIEVASDPNIAMFLSVDDILREIQELKMKADQVDDLQHELDCQKCCVVTQQEKILKLCGKREMVQEALRCRTQSADQMQLELDRLRLQLTEMRKLQLENIDLQNKNKQMQESAQQAVQPDLQFAKEQCVEIEKLKKEKHELFCTIVARECELVQQEEQIDRLVKHVERLTIANDQQQAKSRQVVCQLRDDLHKKTNYITQMDSNLEGVEEKLKQSIATISNNSSEMQNKLCDMVKVCERYKVRNDCLESTVLSLREKLKKLEETNRKHARELLNKNKQQLENGNALQAAKRKLCPRKMAASRMESILQKSHNAIRMVVQRLAKDYRCNLDGIEDMLPKVDCV